MGILQNKHLRASIKRIILKYGATDARLFGSCARNEQRKNSDIDIVLEMPKQSSLVDFVGLKNDLEVKLGNKVDLVTYKSIKPALKDRILREAISL